MKLNDIIHRIYPKEYCEIIVINDNCDCLAYFILTDKKMTDKYKDCAISEMEISYDDDSNNPCVSIRVCV